MAPKASAAVLAGDVPARMTSSAVATMATKNEIWCETPRSSGLTGAAEDTEDTADDGGTDGDTEDGEDVETS